MGKVPARTGRHGCQLIVALALLQAAIQTGFPILDVNLASDSADYVQSAAYRGFAYPAFLDIFDIFADPLRAAVVGQIWIFAAAAAVLSVSFARATGQTGAGLILLALLVINPMTIYFNYSILTESLFQSTLCLYLAYVLKSIRAPKAWHFTALGLSVGAMIAIRPVGFAILPVLVVAVLCAAYINGRKPWAGLALAVLSVFAVLALDRLAYSLHHDDARQSILGNVLFEKSAMLSAGPSPYPADDPRTQAWNMLEQDEPADARELIARAPSGPVSFFLMHSYEASLIFLYNSDRLREIADQMGIPKSDLLAEVGSRRILANPAGFLHLPFQHYVANWQPFYRTTAKDSINDYIAQNGPFPMDNALGYIDRNVFAPPYANAIHTALALGWLASVLTLTAAIFAFGRDWPGRPMLTWAGLGVLSLHALLFLSSTLSIASVRYLAVLWPIVAIVICATVFAFLTFLNRRQNAAGRNLKI